VAPRARSVVPGCPFPAVLPGGAVPGVLFQLERSQWWSADQLARAQLDQLRALVAHAAANVPYYRKALRRAGIDDPTALTWDSFRRLPVLRRADLARHEAALTTSAYPAEHGGTARKTSSGSTGTQVGAQRTALAQLFWEAMTIRDLLWWNGDFQATLGAIRYVSDGRARPPDGESSATWGAPAATWFETGPAHILSVTSSTEEQIAWLKRRRPALLLTYPSVLRALAEALGPEAREIGVRALFTVSEMLAPDVRDAAESAFGVPIRDLYSTQEVGNIALQCPDHPHLHVAAEDVVVEVLRDDGTPCGVGEFGRVVVTPLHNFATVLLRYDVGDYAEVGPPCPCGRGLPVLTRVLGRVRNLLVRPDGTRVWPLFGTWRPEFGVIRRFQVVQTTSSTLVLRFVADREPTPAERDAMRATLLDACGATFDVTFERANDLPRGPSGKFEDFVSHVTVDSFRA
jgi:phenylacetate-CoA ligase